MVASPVRYHPLLFLMTCWQICTWLKIFIFLSPEMLLYLSAGNFTSHSSSVMFLLVSLRKRQRRHCTWHGLGMITGCSQSPQIWAPCLLTNPWTLSWNSRQKRYSNSCYNVRCVRIRALRTLKKSTCGRSAPIPSCVAGILSRETAVAFRDVRIPSP